jgi:hypothetical protein
MGQTLNAQTTSDTALVTTAETIVATVTGVTVPRPGTKVILTGVCQVTTGTNTTALTPRIRRGAAITDTLVGEANPQQIATAAGNTETVEYMAEDTPGEVFNQTYVLTVQQTAASANGSALVADLKAEVIY